MGIFRNKGPAKKGFLDKNRRPTALDHQREEILRQRKAAEILRTKGRYGMTAEERDVVRAAHGRATDRSKAAAASGRPRHRRGR